MYIIQVSGVCVAHTGQWCLCGSHRLVVSVAHTGQ